MEDEPQTSLRAYIDSVHVEGPSTVRDQRFGGSLVFKTKVPFVAKDIARRLSLGLAFSADPDFEKKSGLVNIYQNFYTLVPFVEFDYVKLFRFGVLAGPGLILTETKFDVLNNKETRSELSYISVLGFAIDYAVSSRCELSWHALVQYRHKHKSLDWRQGLGFGFNF